MIHNLLIQNIILVEVCHLKFAEGFNVLSGETGSGKSAIMAALGLIAGQKADSTLIRKGAEKAIVEAGFAIDAEVGSFLNEIGIEHEDGEELLIKRELSLEGKSRAFVNNQRVQVAVLRKLGEQLIAFVGQHANQALFSIDEHRKLVDLFGDLQTVSFKASYEEERTVSKKVDELLTNEAKALRELKTCQAELEEIQSAAVKEGEEEDLFAEYTRLNNSEEIAKNLHDLDQLLSQGLGQLNLGRRSLEELTRMDPAFQELEKCYKSALLELQEVGHSVVSEKSRVEFDPNRLEQLNERLSLINRLKRKYGDLFVYEKETIDRLNTLENRDVEIESLQNKLAKLKEKTDRLAKELTEKREQTAKRLEKAMTDELNALNMKGATFHVHVTAQPRGSTGEDRIEFFLSPNVGESSIAVKECASGGEISRLLLALHTLLAGKEQIPTLLFDEIDANIGGETAVIVGKKLQEIGKAHQLLCITHFPQVATCADHHLKIAKKEEKGRTVTFVELLDQRTKEKELKRMVGLPQG